MAKLNIPFQASGLVTSRKIMRNDPQLIERVARATVDAIQFIAAPANKNRVIQSLMKNLENQRAGKSRNRLRRLGGGFAAQHLPDGSRSALDHEAHGGNGHQSQSGPIEGGRCRRLDAVQAVGRRWGK